MPPTITRLPHSQDLTWNTVPAAANGTVHNTAVTQRPLADALSGAPRATGVLGGLKRFSRRQPVQTVGAAAFDKLKEFEATQQRITQLLPLRANNLHSIVATDGEAFARFEAREPDAYGMPPPQYSIQSARATVTSGTGVCVETNNVLYRALLEAEKTRPRPTLADRARGMNSLPPAPRPLTFAHNHLPHGFVMWGDPRDPAQASEVVVGDSWETLPIVKTWSNASFHEMPYFEKFTATGSHSPIAGLGMDEIAQLSANATPLDRIARFLETRNRPAIGPELLREVLTIAQSGGTTLSDEVTFAITPDLVYRHAETGERFVPSIASHDYQDLRNALSKPKELAAFRSVAAS